MKTDDSAAGIANRVMLVDDDEFVLNSVGGALKSASIGDIICVQDSRKVLSFLNEIDVGVVVLDLSMPHVTGDELLPLIKQNDPDMEVIILTGDAELASAIECMKNGAFDYLVKPVDESKLISAIRKALEIRELKNENARLKNSFLSNELEKPWAFASFITNSTRLRSIFLYIEAIARTNQPVLITGETGTGKELIAEAIHKSSGRMDSLVAANVAGFDDSLFSDTLFGHIKGAFTGQANTRKGLVETARAGTLFLDEIGDLGAHSQIKLLRLLESGEYMPLGSDVSKRSRARIVVATNCCLHQAVEDGTFRKDLYYRLRIHHVELPPLRERTEDIELLADHFIEQAAYAMGADKPSVPGELYPLLQAHPFPGNIRELRSMIYDAVASHSSGPLSLTTFKEKTGLLSTPATTGHGDRLLGFFDRVPTIKQATDLLIDEVMARTEGNQSRAAKLLGVSPQALGKRLRRRREEREDITS